MRKGIYANGRARKSFPNFQSSKNRISLSLQHHRHFISRFSLYSLVDQGKTRRFESEKTSGQELLHVISTIALARGIIIEANLGNANGLFIINRPGYMKPEELIIPLPPSYSQPER